MPEGWGNPFFGWHLNMDWSKYIAAANKKIADDGYDLFGFFFMMMLFKGVFAALAGPAPNYDMQKILSSTITKRSIEDDGLCFHYFIADTLCNGDWFNSVGLTVFQTA